jgi:uncharacterized membrane protein YGL010W
MSSTLKDYSERHRNQMNLLVHIAVVPLFVIGLVGGVVMLVIGQVAWFGAGVALVVYSLMMQKWGHAQEAIPPEPFDGPIDFLNRILTEQFVTFPTFVLSGRWRTNLHAGNQNTRS